MYDSYGTYNTIKRTNQPRQLLTPEVRESSCDVSDPDRGIWSPDTKRYVCIPLYLVRMALDEDSGTPFVGGVQL